MNSIKTVFVVAVLLAIAGGVYISINNNPPTTPPPGTPEGWSNQLNIEMPGPGSATTQFPAGSGGMTADNTAGSSFPAAGSEGSMAPPFTPTQPIPALGSDGAGRYASGNYQPAPAGREQPSSSIRENLALPSDAMRAADPAAADPAGPRPGPGEVRKEFVEFMTAARKKLDQGSLAEVHERLSLYYGNPRLTAVEARQITELLDQVAGTVIYSREHLLENPYTVQPGDTLPKIAESYNVPWQLLAKINGIGDPDQLQPGRKLKVIRGPFNAVIHLNDYELTLMLNGCYAGRFPIGIGSDHAQLEGTYAVRDKTVNPTYYGPDRVVVDADDPASPLGERWIGLDGQIGIHGTADPQNVGRTTGRGSICLGDRDVEDIYDILSVGSRVVIQR